MIADSDAWDRKMIEFGFEGVEMFCRDADIRWRKMIMLRTFAMVATPMAVPTKAQNICCM
jgi:hypothetical protein